jgi:hypothetical protein
MLVFSFRNDHRGFRDREFLVNHPGVAKFRIGEEIEEGLGVRLSGF